MARVLAAALTTVLLGLLLVPAVRALARRVGMVAAPRKDRWHSQPTALLGGVGIFAAFAIGVVIFHDDLGEGLPILAASAFLFVVGLVDDVVQIRPLTKLVAQIVAAGGIVASGLVLPWTHEPVIDAALAMLWIVGITNAVNLLDNMDGLAAGIAAIGCVFLGITFATNGQWDLAVLPALLAGAAVGFLVYNFKPASIFMGDSGSMFLGCLLGGMALLSSYGRSRSVASVLLTPVLIMMIPILDTTLVAITRRLRGQPVSVGGRDHTSHRLVALGASERRAVVILYGLAAASGLVGVAVRHLHFDGLIAIVPAFAAVVALVGLYLARVPVGKGAALATRPGHDSPLLPAKWHAAEVSLDAGLVALAYLGAYLLRWDFDVPPQQASILAATLPVVVTLEGAILWLSGMYRQIWQLARVEDLVTIGRAALVSALTTALVVMWWYGFSGPSRGVLALNLVLLAGLLTGSRFFYRLLQQVIASPAVVEIGKRRAVIYGAGSRGTFLLTEMLSDPSSDTMAVGFIDDRPSESGRRLHGLPLFGPEDLAGLVTRRDIEEVLVAKPDADSRLLTTFEELGLSLRRFRVEIE